jgi:hypothetical protein
VLKKTLHNFRANKNRLLAFLWSFALFAQQLADVSFIQQPSNSATPKKGKKRTGE